LTVITIIRVAYGRLRNVVDDVDRNGYEVEKDDGRVDDVVTYNTCNIDGATSTPSLTINHAKKKTTITT
jgi:hypothetical protein